MVARWLELTSKHLLAFAVGAGFSLVPTAVSAAVLCERPTCLQARDINGLRLGITLEQVTALMPGGLKPLGRGQFQAESGNQSYDLGFSALHHLYRIDSSLNLGYVVPDRTFELDLRRKLVAKYGPPEIGDVPSGVLWWTFAERYQTNNSALLTRETESLSASLSGGFGLPMKLNLKLMDFRILRHDLEVLNRQPEAEARARVEF